MKGKRIRAGVIMAVAVMLLTFTACTKRVEVYLNNLVEVGFVEWHDGSYHVVSRLKEEELVGRYKNNLIITDMDVRISDLKKELGNEATPAELLAHCISYSLDKSQINEYERVYLTWNIDEEILKKEFNCKFEYEERLDYFRYSDSLGGGWGYAPNGLAEKEPVSIYEANVADFVRLGQYEQDNSLGNGKEDIEWIVLAKEKGKLLLISRFALDCMPYHDDASSYVAWEKCTLRQWLNREFYENAFSEDEKYLILKASDGKTADASEEQQTGDYVFLLSEEETDSYFKNKNGICNWTKYAEEQCVNKTGYNWNISQWWLRGNEEGYYCYDCTFKWSRWYNRVTIDPYDLTGVPQILRGLGVRPAIWVSIE